MSGVNFVWRRGLIEIEDSDLRLDLAHVCFNYAVLRSRTGRPGDLLVSASIFSFVNERLLPLLPLHTTHFVRPIFVRWCQIVMLAEQAECRLKMDPSPVSSCAKLSALCTAAVLYERADRVSQVRECEEAVGQCQVSIAQRMHLYTIWTLLALEDATQFAHAVTSAQRARSVDFHHYCLEHRAK